METSGMLTYQEELSSVLESAPAPVLEIAAVLGTAGAHRVDIVLSPSELQMVVPSNEPSRPPEVRSGVDGIVSYRSQLFTALSSTAASVQALTALRTAGMDVSLDFRPASSVGSEDDSACLMAVFRPELLSGAFGGFILPSSFAMRPASPVSDGWVRAGGLADRVRLSDGVVEFTVSVPAASSVLNARS